MNVRQNDLATEHLRKRSSFLLGSIFHHLQQLAEIDHNHPLLLLSPFDGGVARNGGRTGARFGAQAILAVLAKMVHHLPWPALQVFSILPSVPEEDFALFQQESGHILAQALLQRPLGQVPVVHLGGGHDHIYPLLMALQKSQHNKITVINIDAHCDTRIDPLAHSGTPFRQFAQQATGDFELIQFGIHPYANTQETMSPLGERGRMHIHLLKKIFTDDGYYGQSIIKYLDQHIKVDPQRLYVLSLDCDAIDASIMEGVSAVNPQGLSTHHINGFVSWFQTRLTTAQRIYGIYEYNPIYDNLSQKGAKAVATILYDIFSGKK